MYFIVAIAFVVFGQISTVPLENAPLDSSVYFDSRIVGGSPAPLGKAPHMVGLVFGAVVKSFVCGGSIISKRHVLTAAHCLTSFVDWDGNLLSTYSGVIGTNTWNEGGTEINFLRHHNHPQYNPFTIKNDCGIIVTTEEISFNDRVSIIQLNFEWVGGGEKSQVTGWGTEVLWGSIPHQLNILHVETISGAECVERMWEIYGPLGIPVEPALEICTFHSPGHGMCHGDSGSALVSEKSKLQSGIVSWGVPCAVGGPDVFVRVKPMKPFILDILHAKL